MRIFSDFETGGAGQPAVDVNYLRERVRANLSGVRATLAIASVNGGVGKSVVAVNVAAALALKGRKVAIVDADLNSPSIGALLGMKRPRRYPMIEGIEPIAGPHGLRIVSSDLLPGGEPPPMGFAPDESEGEAAPPVPERPAELSYSEALQRIFTQSQFGALDLLIVDLATGLDRLHAVAAMVKLDGVLLLCRPSAQDAAMTRHAIEIATRAGAHITGLVENMVGYNCDNCRSVRPLWPEGDLHGVASEAGVPILARLAFEPRLADSSDRGELFVREYAATPTAKQLGELAAQLESMLAARVAPPPA
ncbi:MAG TPA: P-loop NTPase [Candidatus Acidoferrales bacterium]|nr:P-loop NTPase [Candidatus Acidoferrales bacterium]